MYALCVILRNSILLFFLTFSLVRAAFSFLYGIRQAIKYFTTSNSLSCAIPNMGRRYGCPKVERGVSSMFETLLSLRGNIEGVKNTKNIKYNYLYKMCIAGKKKTI